jgi:ABC-2 type transport system ATP-binding protein
MRQKLGLARALLHRPTLLFLDEPTAGLDPEAAAALRTDLLRLRGDGVTIFLTSHNLFEAERLCDLVGVIRQGRLRAFGPPDALAPDGPVGSDRRTLEDAYLEIMSRPAEQGA